MSAIHYGASNGQDYSLISVLKSLAALIVICLRVVESRPSTECGGCVFFVETFNHGMKETENAHFGGGNTAWESEKLGKYSSSETRLVEIMERACKKSDKIKTEKDDEHKCHSFVEQHEEMIENWYFHRQSTDPDLYKWLCIESSNVCCPPNTFGPDCEQCPGEVDRPCFDHGKCDGSGTRVGTGKCTCDEGYQGNLCRKCASNYFASFKNDTHITCEKCDVSCKGGCEHGGTSGCIGCKPGWTMIEGEGCKDVDECQTSSTLCNSETEACLNTVGSYQCQCKDGYKRENGDCVFDLSAVDDVAGNTSDDSPVSNLTDDALADAVVESTQQREKEL